jgi:anhydro-N-acetylmuramic acid kinase
VAIIFVCNVGVFIAHFMEPGLTIGLMSGTSADGVDAVLLRTYGATCKTVAHTHVPFAASLRTELLALMLPRENEIERAGRASVALAHVYASAVNALLESAKVPTAQVRAIGAHGQTVRHRPEQGYSVQLNQPALLAHLTGIDVVFDFRSAHIAAGGQGAPLVPKFHEQVFAHAQTKRAIVNIGGIANVTLLVPGEPTRGWDTGPGNCLLDAWCERHLNTGYDARGAWAASGQVHTKLLEEFLGHPYLRRNPPKSTGREVFHLVWVDEVLREKSIDPQDVQATLCALTARSIAAAIREAGVHEVFVCGGGAFNETLMTLLAQCVPTAQIDRTDALGINVMQVEAAAFAWFAHENWLHRTMGAAPTVPAAYFAAQQA